MILVIWFSLFTTPAMAESIFPFAAIGFEFGGDPLANAVYSDGSRSELEAGRGLLLQAGGLMPLGDGFEAQGSFGLKWASLKPARNGEVSWVRWPLELLGFYRLRPIRMGGGLVYQFANRLNGTKDAAHIDLKFKDALGFVLAAEWLFGEEEGMGVGLRYTSLAYRPGNAASAVDGGSLGLAFQYVFH